MRTEKSSRRTALLGIDVGTGSARAAIFDSNGGLLGSAKQAIRTWHETGDIVEQSTADIWSAVCGSVRETLANANLEPSDIGGVGVDATCSLAVVDPMGSPLAVGPSGNPERNVIVWMDHRAIEQAQRINDTGHPVLAYVGGHISPEMEAPKLLWLREHKQDTFISAGHFFDLSDYLTWRLSGSLARSVCTVTCKWNYLSHERRWDRSYFEAIGLGDLAQDFVRIGTEIVDPGTALGNGLTAEAANNLGLISGTPVGAALIDAHAGGVGTVGAENAGSVECSLAYILGTSACAMATMVKAIFVTGIWGPYYSAMIPGYWLNEAGQSAAGAAIDYLVEAHPAFGDARTQAAKEGLSVVPWLQLEAVKGVELVSKVALRAHSIHVVPDFNGNRSPFADPGACAVIAGLRADRSISSLLDLYVAGLCGLAYGLGQIISALRQEGIRVERLVVSGGAAQSELVCQILADATELPVAIPASREPVLLGAAMLGATAAKFYPDLCAAMSAMSRIAHYRYPDESISNFHRSKAAAFVELQEAERRTRRLVSVTTHGR